MLESKLLHQSRASKDARYSIEDCKIVSMDSFDGPDFDLGHDDDESIEMQEKALCRKTRTLLHWASLINDGFCCSCSDDSLDGSWGGRFKASIADTGAASAFAGPAQRGAEMCSLYEQTP